MIRILMTAAILAMFATQSEARLHKPTTQEFCGDRYCSGPIVDSVNLEGVRIRGKSRKIRDYFQSASHGKDGCRSGIAALSCVVAPLATKAKEIVDSCGSQVASAIAGRPNKSNHPIGRAVDLVGNPTCIYSHLGGWPGGYSTDYGRVHHVHISYNPGGQEWGIRFVHGGHHRVAMR